MMDVLCENTFSQIQNKSTKVIYLLQNTHGHYFGAPGLESEWARMLFLATSCHTSQLQTSWDSPEFLF